MDIEQQIQIIESQLVKLKLELQNKDTKQIKLKDGDGFYYIDEEGIYPDSWYGYGTDNEKLNIGNIFLTEQDAKAEIKYRQIDYKLHCLADDVDWSNFSKSKFGLVYNYKKKSIYISDHSWVQSNEHHFNSEANVRGAIKTIGENDLKLYLTYKSKALKPNEVEM